MASERNCTLALVVVAGLGGCAAAPTTNFATGAPMLGVGFGHVVTVEAEAIVEQRPKGSTEPLLHVRRIDGSQADLRIPWTYGGLFAERASETFPGGFEVVEGNSYRLRGYETGGWEGMPDDAVKILMDEFGPPQGKGFHFRSVFRVLDGERMDGGQ